MQPYSRENMLNLLEKGAFRRHNVNKLLKAYEGQVSGKGKYKNCDITCKDGVITISKISGEKKNITIKLESIEKHRNISFIARARYALKSNDKKLEYRARLAKVIDDRLLPPKDGKKIPDQKKSKDSSSSHEVPKYPAQQGKDPSKKPSSKDSSSSHEESDKDPSTKSSSKDTSSSHEESDNSSKAQAAHVSPPPAKVQSAEELFDEAEKHFDSGDNIEGLRFVQQAADKGHLEALFTIGLMYSSGTRGVKADPKEAEKHFKKAADKGHVESQVHLGMHYDSIGYTNDAFTYFQMAAPKSAVAAFHLGLMEKHSRNNEKAIDCFEKAAALGHNNAHYMLGNCYELGDTGVKQDFAKALKYYQAAADNGDMVAQYKVADWFKNGLHGSEINFSEARKYYKLAADQGHPSSAATLKILESFEKGCTAWNAQKYDEALPFLQSASKEIPGAQMMLGNYYHMNAASQDDYKTAFDYYFLAAKSGHVQAELQLAECYENAIGTNQNLKEAFKYYKIAADKNNPNGQYQLARCYENGIGTKKNITEAFKYCKAAEANGQNLAAGLMADYRKKAAEGVDLWDAGKYEESIMYLLCASDKGDVNAQLRLGMGYSLGLKGFGKDPELSAWFYEKAADQGNADAQAAFGLSLLEGNHVLKDLKKAFRYFTMAGAQGSPIGLYYLGYCLEEGIGVDKNKELAIANYKEAANAGNLLAQYKLGLHYKELATSTTGKYEEALKYLNLAATAGLADANYELGEFYNQPPHFFAPALAFKYYKAAADQKHIEACYKVGTFYEEGKGTTKDLEKAQTYYAKVLGITEDKGHPEAEAALKRVNENLNKK